MWGRCCASRQKDRSASGKKDLAPPKNFWIAAESRMSFRESNVDDMKALLKYPCWYLKKSSHMVISWCTFDSAAGPCILPLAAEKSN